VDTIFIKIAKKRQTIFQLGLHKALVIFIYFLLSLDFCNYLSYFDIIITLIKTVIFILKIIGPVYAFIAVVGKRLNIVAFVYIVLCQECASPSRESIE